MFDEFQKIKIAKKYNKKFNIKEDTIKILYAPTFRKNLGIDAYRLNFDKIIKAFEKKFNKKTVILIKLHPNVLHLKDQFEYSNNVIDANNVTDTQELEIYADMIISDYSSMLFEFLLMNKPGFIYANDFEEYMKERQLYFDLSKLPFPFAIFEDEFIQNIKTFDEEAYIEKVNDFKDQQKPICDGKASKKVVQWLKEKMEEGNADDAQKNSKHN